MAFRLECICGAWIDVDDPNAAGPVRCAGCGVEFELRGLLDGAEVEATAAPAQDSRLQCPSCGGRTEVVMRDAGGRDRILSCLYCGTEVDLPESRGTTRERVTERPGERVVERVTSWESMGPAGAPELPQPPDDVDVSQVSEHSFDSLDAMERKLREQLPEGMAEQALAALRRAVVEGDGRSGSTVIEHSEVTTETTLLPDGAKRRR